MCRLLDVHSTEGRYEHQLIIYMVFEHMDQDLDQFIRQCPPPGMDDGVIKVSINVVFVSTGDVLW